MQKKLVWNFHPTESVHPFLDIITQFLWSDSNYIKGRSCWK